MENASKALLIAAAVLIVILIIAFSLRIFNATADVSNQTTQIGGALTNQTVIGKNAAITAIDGTGKWSTQ